jgi:hypothetical protein
MKIHSLVPFFGRFFGQNDLTQCQIPLPEINAALGLSAKCCVWSHNRFGAKMNFFVPTVRLNTLRGGAVLHQIACPSSPLPVLHWAYVQLVILPGFLKLRRPDCLFVG